ncbi:Hypothetical protein A7982_11092 [Minicystis rosea]|nr:Hypothetical protein A7982_11092 [Minicystis rosea]
MWGRAPQVNEVNQGHRASKAGAAPGRFCGAGDALAVVFCKGQRALTGLTGSPSRCSLRRRSILEGGSTLHGLTSNDRPVALGRHSRQEHRRVNVRAMRAYATVTILRSGRARSSPQSPPIAR